MFLIKEALKRLLSKPFTIKYPQEKPELPEGVRGKHIWKKEKCIFCLLCQNSCPTGAIAIDKEKKQYRVDLGKCIFCGRCQEVCPVPGKAIILGKEYELSAEKRENTIAKL